MRGRWKGGNGGGGHLEEHQPQFEHKSDSKSEIT